jgi:uncharacterized protein YbjT (DUF2867 family)
MKTSSILVTGATGTVGRAVLRALHARGLAATAAVRSLDRVPAEAAAGVVFDFAKPETFAPALAGHDRLFLIGPPLVPDLDTLMKPFIDFLIAAGPRRVVYLSANGMDELPDLPFHGINEKLLRTAPNLALTVLRPGFFAQNFANYGRPDIEERGILFFPAGSGKTAFIDVADIGHSAAAVLSEDGHAGKTYTLTGPEAWSMADVAATLTRLLGRPIHDVAPTPDVFRSTLAQAGVPPFIAEYLIPVYGLIARGAVASVTDDVRRLTGRAPRSPAEVLAEQFGPHAQRAN